MAAALQTLVPAEVRKHRQQGQPRAAQLEAQAAGTMASTMLYILHKKGVS